MKNQNAIDPFSRRLMGEVATRFMKRTKEGDRAAALARAGMLCEFTDHELMVLWIGGYLCMNDVFALKRSGRNDPSKGKWRL